MPEKTKILLDSLGINSKSNFTFGTLEPNTSISMANNLFPRIEEDK